MTWRVSAISDSLPFVDPLTALCHHGARARDLDPCLGKKCTSQDDKGNINVHVN